MVSSITLKWNIFRTIRGIYKWSMATIFQLILIATQEYCYPRKCEVVMLMILCILEGKHLYSVLTLQLWLLLEPHLHSESDCNGIFHNFKMKYLQNYKRHLQVVNGVCLLFIGCLVSDQLAFWVDFPFNHCLSEFLLTEPSQLYQNITQTACQYL